MKWSIGKPASFGFLFLMAFLVVNGGLAYYHTRRIADAAAAFERSAQVTYELEHSLSLFKDLETGQRGYLITGEDSYLGPYRSALGELADCRLRLGRLAASFPVGDR